MTEAPTAGGSINRFDVLLQEFALVLKQRRQRLGLRMRDVAWQSGLSESSLSRLENGQRIPEAKTLMALAEAYKVRIVLGDGGVWMEIPE